MSTTTSANTNIPATTNSNSKLEISSLYSSSEHEKLVKEEEDDDEKATTSSTTEATTTTDASSSSSSTGTANHNNADDEEGMEDNSKPAAAVAVAEKDNDFATAQAGEGEIDDKQPAEAAASAEVADPPAPAVSPAKQQEGGDASHNKNNDNKKQEEATVPLTATATQKTADDDSDSDSSSEDEIFPPKRIRSSIKLSTLNQDIPINLGRKSFRMLPKPDMDKVRKAATLPAYMSPEEVFRIMSGSTNHEEDRSNLNVKFGNVSIRQHEQTISDNPSVSYGTPIGLDWNYQQKEAVALEDYEQERDGKRRTFKKLGLNYYQRKAILEGQGSSEGDIRKAKKQAEKDKFKRAVTKYFLPVQKLEDAAESGFRKMRRSFGGKKNKK